ncbi:toxin [Bdellovibrio bacteriovorus]|uniref:toxin n=1 Tax=Bdellovibrio bacteriovorus TaxID=959 RepID=UPI0035A6FD4F
MKRINADKNRKIQRERGHSIEEVVTGGVLLDVRANPKYPKQFVEIYFLKDYVWAVVTAEDPERYITMYKSRKLKKEYGL